jgi:hypothetical protein
MIKIYSFDDFIINLKIKYKNQADSKIDELDGYFKRLNGIMNIFNFKLLCKINLTVPEEVLINSVICSNNFTRVEFDIIDLVNPKKLALLGDKFLQYKAVLHLINLNRVQDIQNKIINIANNSLSLIYDELFDQSEILIYDQANIGPMTARQKAEFIESLIGAMIHYNHNDTLANFIPFILNNEHLQLN